MKNMIKTSISIILILVIAFSCKKEEVVEDVNITSESNNMGTTLYEPTYIQYEVEGPEVESICLWVNDEIVITHTSIQNIFVYSFSELGTYSVYVSVFYQGGKEKKTSRFEVHVKPYEVPDIRFKMSSIFNYYESFIGDTFNIEVVSENSWYFMDTTESVCLLINNDTIGCVIGPQFIFDSVIINQEINDFHFSFKDNYGITRIYEEVKEFQYNPLPEIEIDIFGFEGDEGCFFDDQIVKIQVRADENTMITRVECYLDDQLVSEEEVNYSHYSEPITLNRLAPGEYKFHVIVFDDRYHFKKSDDLFFKVKHCHEFPFGDNFIEMKHTENPSIVYALSPSKLFIINPILEIIEEEILPFDYAVSMDYIGNGILYIVSKYGDIAIRNENSQGFEVIDMQGFSLIRDIEIDAENQQMFFVNSNQLYNYNFVTEDTVSFHKTLSDYPCLAFDEINKLIIVGGDEESSDGRFYKLSFMDNSFNQLARGDMSGFSKEIILNPQKKLFMIRCWRDAAHIWDLENFGAEETSFDIRYSEAVSYSKDYSQIALAEASGPTIYFFNGLNYMKNKEFNLSLAFQERIKLICPTQENDKWLVCIVKHGDYMKLGFIDVDE